MPIAAPTARADDDAADDAATRRGPRRPRSLTATLRCFRHGSLDPTTRLGPSGFARATFTPDGPATVLVRWRGDICEDVAVDAWGPGGDWLASTVPAITGDHDHAPRLPTVAACVTRAERDHGGLRIGASGTLYHELLPTIIAQRITAGEAVRQWRRLCIELGEPAPGPVAGLRLPPPPSQLARRPAWWFHPIGIESKRARALAEVARHADRLWDWTTAGPATAAAKLALLPGIGPWTVGSVLGPALGDPDAVPIGDYHIPSLVAWNLAGEARADDERMLALLVPFDGQRGRVIRLLGMTGVRAPARGPRRRILPMHRW
jgi:3-methyladenine DNA glycosylase/8-oxoguanine DNA glycosylase